MQIYYLYLLSTTRHIQARVDLEARDDADAIALAEREPEARAMELWCGARMVWSRPAQPTDDPAG